MKKPQEEKFHGLCKLEEYFLWLVRRGLGPGDVCLYRVAIARHETRAQLDALAWQKLAIFLKEKIMPDAKIQTQQQEDLSIVDRYLRSLAEDLSQGRDGAAARMVFHPQLGLVTSAEAKSARQHGGWDTYRRY